MHSHSLLQRTLFERTLKRALDIVGDEQRLARRLRVPQADLHAWLAGLERPPTAAFLTAVDIVVGSDDARQVHVAIERRRKPRHQMRFAG
jgi:DNA-binding transcriptional regulator YdaS (Cro superfamily)